MFLGHSISIYPYAVYEKWLVCISTKAIVEDTCIADSMIWSSGFNMFEYKEQK